MWQHGNERSDIKQREHECTIYRHNVRHHHYLVCRSENQQYLVFSGEGCNHFRYPAERSVHEGSSYGQER